MHEQHVRTVSVGGAASHGRPVGSPVARQPVAVHLRDPVLPAVPGRRRKRHPAAARRRLAEGMAAACRVRLPGPPAAAGTPVPVLPAAGHVRGTRSSRLADPARPRRRPAPRPMPCRPAAPGRRTTAAPAGPGSTPRPGTETIPWPPMTCSTVQDRLLQMLNPGEPARSITSVGQPAMPARYFADLRLVCSLLNGAWPHSRDLITAPGMGQGPRPVHRQHQRHRAPAAHALRHPAAGPASRRRPHHRRRPHPRRRRPAGPRRVPGPFPERRQPQKPARPVDSAATSAQGHDCSSGFRDALEPLTGRFQRTDRRTRGRRAPAPQVAFAPDHVPEHLQDDWYDQHFRHIGGNTRLLRRAAALRLVQMSAGGSLAEAAAFLGIDHRYLRASPGSAAFTGDPAEFRLAVHALAGSSAPPPA